MSLNHSLLTIEGKCGLYASPIQANPATPRGTTAYLIQFNIINIQLDHIHSLDMDSSKNLLRLTIVFLLMG